MEHGLTGKFSMLRINLYYFSSRARLNFRWIFKEFDLKSNMKGFFENLLALSVKKLKKVLMIPPSITGRAWTSVSCRMLSLYARLSLGTCSHRLPIF